MHVNVMCVCIYIHVCVCVMHDGERVFMHVYVCVSAFMCVHARTYVCCVQDHEI
jgi:hypothetical protein